MNVYFYTTDPKIDNPINMAVIAALQKEGAIIFSNLEGLSHALDLPHEIDALIALCEGKKSETAYVVALAIARNRPILYLAPKGSEIPAEIMKISESKDVRKRFAVKFFVPKKIGIIIKGFFESGAVVDDAYTIKFTLRFNKSLERYVQKASKRRRMTKATFCRKIIEEYREADKGSIVS